MPLDLKNKIMIENILDTDLDFSASLSILNLSYHNLRQFFKMTDHAHYLEIAKSVILKAYELAADDAVCCVISTDEKDPTRDTLELLGTRVVQNIGPWNLSDEIIWNKKPDDLAAADHEKQSVIDFEEAPFSQIWILSKQKMVPDRDSLLAGANMTKQKKIEITSSVWNIPPKSQHGYSDPLPCELLARLIMTYSVPGCMVFDPFTGHGATASACRSLGRNFLCFARDSHDLGLCKKRLEDN